MTNKIRVAIVGLGNCAKSLVEGVARYNLVEDTTGLAFPTVGNYTPGDIEFVAGFDVDGRKTGKFIYEAIQEYPNNAIDLLDYNKLRDYEALKRVASGVVVRGPTLDGVAPHMETSDEEDTERFYIEDGNTPATLDEVVQYLRDSRADVLLNYLPVGSQEATEFYYTAALKAGVNFVNCIPVFIAANAKNAQAAVDAGITLIGDDMRSMVGASIISTVLQDCFMARGAQVEVHYQDNVGGNTDFLNMQDQGRLQSKKISKENVVKNQYRLHGQEPKDNSVAAGPAKYFPDLGDNKRAHWLIKGTIFGGAPFEFTADLSCQDSPNSAGVVIDAIRLVKVANDMGVVGPILGPSAFTQKTPPVDLKFSDAYNECRMLASGLVPDYYLRDEATGKFRADLFALRSMVEGVVNDHE